MGFENTILLIAHFEDSRKNEYTFLFIFEKTTFVCLS